MTHSSQCDYETVPNTVAGEFVIVWSFFDFMSLLPLIRLETSVIGRMCASVLTRYTFSHLVVMLMDWASYAEKVFFTHVSGYHIRITEVFI